MLCLCCGEVANISSGNPFWYMEYDSNPFACNADNVCILQYFKWKSFEMKEKKRKKYDT